MRVKALVEHSNDYGPGPGVAIGDERVKAKGKEYDIPDEAEAKILIDAGIVANAAEASATTEKPPKKPAKK